MVMLDGVSIITPCKAKARRFMQQGSIGVPGSPFAFFHQVFLHVSSRGDGAAKTERPELEEIPEKLPKSGDSG